VKLIVAQGQLLEEIIDATFPIWNEGLTRSAYAKWNAAQMRTEWGRENLQRFALVDDRGRWVASAKRYAWPIQLDGMNGTMCGIGALFTRPEERGRGYAGALIEQLLDRARAEGTVLAGLFSEIGEALYRRLGFQTVPLFEVDVRVERREGSPAMHVRSGEPRDLPTLASMHDVRSARVRFRLRRSVPLIEYALSKKRLLAGLGSGTIGRGMHNVEFFVVEEGGSAVAYVVLTVSRGGWTLEEAGDRDPAGARLGALLQVLLARNPAAPPAVIRAWWPPVFPVPPQVRLVNRMKARDVFMLRAIADVAIPSQERDIFYWRSDYF